MGNKNSTNFEYEDFLHLIKDQNKQQIHSQQYLLQQYYCVILNHKNKTIEGLCINKKCNQPNRRTCFDCIVDKLHDKDHKHKSLIKNGDQIDVIIQEFKSFIHQYIDKEQFQFYYESLQFCEEPDEKLACIKYTELKKIYDQIELIKIQLNELTLKSYLSKQSTSNISLFQYLKDYHSEIMQINARIIDYKKIKVDVKYQLNITKYFQVDQKILDEMQVIRKKKRGMIKLLMATDEFKNDNISKEQKDYLIKILENLISEFNQVDENQKILLNEICDLLFQLYPKDATFYNNKGYNLYNKKKYEQAIIMHNQAINLNPNEHAYYNNIGLALLEMQEFEQANSMYDKAIQLDPNVATYYQYKALALLAIKKLDQVITMFDKAIQLNPKESKFYYFKGLTLYDIEKYEQAHKMFSQAIELNQQEADYYNYNGLSLKQIKNFDQSLVMFNKAIEISPKVASYYQNKGDSLLLLKKYDQAIKVYDQAIDLNPNISQYYFLKGEALRLLQNFEQAIIMYNQAISLDSNVADYHKMRDLVLNGGNFEDDSNNTSEICKEFQE